MKAKLMDRVDSASQFKLCWRCYQPIPVDEREYDAEGLCFDCFNGPGLFKELDDFLGRIDKEIAKDKHLTKHETCGHRRSEF